MPGTRRESSFERNKAGSTYEPGVTYILEYRKGSGAVKKEAFTRPESRDKKEEQLKRAGYTIVSKRTERKAG
jgi:hypothetical protein